VLKNDCLYIIAVTLSATHKLTNFFGRYRCTL